MTNGVKRPPPDDTSHGPKSHGHAAPSVSHETPLRSVQDLGAEDSYADESFEGDFAGMEDSFFDHVVESVQVSHSADR